MILDDSIKAAKFTGTILNSKPTVNVVSLCHRGVHLLTSCMGDIDSKKNCLQGIYYILYYISLFGRNQVLFASICYHFTQFVSFENNNSTRASIHKRTVSARSGLRLRCNKLFSSMPDKLRQTGANASSTVSPTSFQGIF